MDSVQKSLLISLAPLHDFVLLSGLRCSQSIKHVLNLETLKPITSRSNKAVVLRYFLRQVQILSLNGRVFKEGSKDVVFEKKPDFLLTVFLS